MKNSAEIVKIIHEAKDAVDSSSFGPIFSYPDPQDITKKNINQLAWAVFVTVLTAMLDGSGR